MMNDKKNQSRRSSRLDIDFIKQANLIFVRGNNNKDGKFRPGEAPIDIE